MPITVFSGLPGNGKTAFMIDHLIDEAAKHTNGDNSARPLFAFGIDGLDPTLATVLPDPKQWNAVREGHVCTCKDTDNPDPCDAHVIPNGALIYIDEAWKWFGHLHDASRQATPPHVLELAEHRHRGLDFVWTTQGPGQIYPFARNLCQKHHHHVRKFGTKYVDVFVWQELCEEVKSQAKRDLAQRSTKALPTRTFGRYKSAEVHTIKPGIPWKVKAAAASLLLVPVMLWYGYDKLRPAHFAQTLGQEGTKAAPADSSPSGGMGGSTGTKGKNLSYATAGEYVEALTPRIPAMPWTARAFDGRAVVSEPRIFCGLSGAGLDADGKHQAESCTCLTEQGTKYSAGPTPEAHFEQCKTLALIGEGYNPFRKPEADRPQTGVTGATPSAMGANAPAPSPGAMIEGDQISGYGDIGVGNTEAAPR